MFRKTSPSTPSTPWTPPSAMTSATLSQHLDPQSDEHKSKETVPMTSSANTSSTSIGPVPALDTILQNNQAARKKYEDDAKALDERENKRLREMLDNYHSCSVALERVNTLIKEYGIPASKLKAAHKAGLDTRKKAKAVTWPKNPDGKRKSKKV